MEINDLKLDAHNFNKHTEEGMSLLEKSITENKFGRSVLVDKDNNIIAGNGVVESARNLGKKKIKVVETTGDELVVVKRTDLDIDSKEGRSLALADNSISAVSLNWDEEEIKAASEEWGIVPEDWGVELPEMEEPINSEDDDFDEDSPVDKRCNPGDIWALGDHRLMCGDSTRMEDVARLMDGDLADLYLTDPPYNVNYEGKTNEKLKIQNDSMEDEAFLSFLKDAFSAADSVIKKGAVFYIWHADSEGFNFRYAVKLAGWDIKECLIWNKNQMVMGRQDYQWKHEPCLYGWKGGAAHKWYSDRKQTTVLDFDKPQRSNLHPTMKPIPLFAYQIENSSKKGDIVLDSFGGSGTTMMACEQMGRKARIMELDPHYCDVIISRWETMTGKKAEKI